MNKDEKNRNPETIGTVTHTHTHTHKYNLKDKKYSITKSDILIYFTLL